MHGLERIMSELIGSARKESLIEFVAIVNLGMC
jgi:hypothetical protein